MAPLVSWSYLEHGSENWEKVSLSINFNTGGIIMWLMRLFYITSVCIIMVTLIFVVAFTAYAKKIGAASLPVEEPAMVLLMDAPGGRP